MGYIGNSPALNESVTAAQIAASAYAKTKIHEYPLDADTNVDGNTTGTYLSCVVTPSSSTSKLYAFHYAWGSQGSSGTTTIYPYLSVSGDDVTNIDRALGEMRARQNAVVNFLWAYTSEEILLDGTGTADVTFAHKCVSDHANNTTAFQGNNQMGSLTHTSILEIY